VDDTQVRFCTHLKGKDSWFLPFNKGYNDGAGNPPNPHGLATDYLWKETLSKAGLTDILENYAQIVEEKDEKTGKKRYKQIFLRHRWPCRTLRRPAQIPQSREENHHHHSAEIPVHPR
jgi:type I restriction enzyme R subunit